MASDFERGAAADTRVDCCARCVTAARFRCDPRPGRRAEPDRARAVVVEATPSRQRSRQRGALRAARGRPLVLRLVVPADGRSRIPRVGRDRDPAAGDSGPNDRLRRCHLQHPRCRRRVGDRLDRAAPLAPAPLSLPWRRHRVVRVLRALVLTIVVAGALGSASAAWAHPGAAPSNPRPPGGIYGVAPVAGTPLATGGNLLYHGGPIMQTSTTYTIYWAPTGQTMSANYRSIIDGFYQDVAAASGQSSSVYASDVQYYMGSSPKVFIQNSSTFGGSFVDTTTPIPAGTCGGQYGAPIAPHLTGCVTDVQVQNEIEHVLSVTGWTPGPSKLFVLFTPRSVGSCASVFGTCAYTTYCAYHSDYLDAQGDVLYANQPYSETTQLAIGAVCDSGQHPNGDWADATLNVASHEHNEAITDPNGNAWFDSVGDENGDKCAWTFGTPLGSTGYGQYNQVIGTGKYYLQEEWSNAASSCVLAYGTAGVPTSTSLPSIGGSAVQGQALTLATGSWTGSP